MGRLRSGTRTEELMDAIRAKIASRAIGPGDRLPSVRGFAETMSVSPSTVVEAYDRLAAEGVISARRGSGFYVTGSSIPPMSVSEMGPRRDRAVDPFWISRQSLDADTSMVKPGCGWLPTDWMPNAALRKALRSLARGEDALLTEYGSTRGSLALRRLLLGRFAEEGIDVSADQVLLTGSGTQAIDLICRFLLHPGDTVLVDDPGYFNFQALLRAHRVKLIGIPYTPTGPDTAAFEAALIAHKPRLYITNSALHNPTGTSISYQTAHRLLGAAGAHDLTIVEDDIFADFEPSLPTHPRHSAANFALLGAVRPLAGSSRPKYAVPMYKQERRGGPTPPIPCAVRSLPPTKRGLTAPSEVVGTCHPLKTGIPRSK